MQSDTIADYESWIVNSVGRDGSTTKLHDDCDVGDSVRALELRIMMMDRDPKIASASRETPTVCKHDISSSGSRRVHRTVKCWV
jgi:hypothetical protein